MKIRKIPKRLVKNSGDKRKEIMKRNLRQRVAFNMVKKKRGPVKKEPYSEEILEKSSYSTDQINDYWDKE